MSADANLRLRARAAQELRLEAGICSQRGLKPRNDDAAGWEQGGIAGAALVIADGVSSSDAGGEAAQAAVNGFINDYFSTPDSWSASEAGARVLRAINSWLFRQGYSGAGSALSGGGRDAWLTTFCAVIFKGRSAHLLHVGDSRVYRLRDGELEQLTRDHSTGGHRRFLGRALGMDQHLEIDYRCEALQAGDLFLLSTDGVHDALSPSQLRMLASSAEPQQAAEELVRSALLAGSDDNLTAAICRVDALPEPEATDLLQQTRDLPIPPALVPGNRIDNFLVLEELHSSSRSHIYLAEDLGSGDKVVLKAPSQNFVDDPDYLEMFAREEWIGRRLDHPGIVRIHTPHPERRFLYHAMELVPGKSLRQWMADNPAPEIDQVRDIVAQVASALRRLQRMSVIHQDLKPENIMVCPDGRIKLIDFGAARVAGLGDYRPEAAAVAPGSKNYIAPEYFRQEPATQISDLFSLGVITYELLTGRYPYKERFGSSFYQLRNYAQFEYRPATRLNKALPAWLDGALAKACAADPAQRYQALSEFMTDLREPNPAFTPPDRRPLIERNPVLVWQLLSLLLVGAHLLRSL
ncbi:bifunctional protein-serine/threonine kinase/phosphatase [Biformimicrobium ophioploci]|uniref:Bifunctional protein-serine/threonine kinase/phosphatase n=1 Tax=Biformimicrobium ophioploci TaxID=3036711 RepID=A0ABQ6M032_9GAMM|nr:bifunctional protein-serine/threonine kinase/phosphatase [Microbulbifer sp. NKW57]GMG87714.1 bifunctional protein-serine/threonine kinase/phosphatase [Microbulbifer sp. NKW57]